MTNRNKRFRNLAEDKVIAGGLDWLARKLGLPAGQYIGVQHVEDDRGHYYQIGVFQEQDGGPVMIAPIMGFTKLSQLERAVYTLDGLQTAVHMAQRA